MKKLILIFTLLALSDLSFGFELTKNDARNLLKDKQINLDQMIKKGHTLMLGEWTGAGRTAPLDGLKAVFHADGVILKKEIKAMNLKGAPGKTLADILTIKTKEEMLKKTDILGVLVKKTKE